MKIFPAIDIKDKKCVRLVKGNFDNKTEYEISPVDQAGKYKDHDLCIFLLDQQEKFRTQFYYQSFLSLILHISYL